MKTEFQTIAEKVRQGKVLRRYVLKSDSKGFFFDGMHAASFRRKTRSAIEDYAVRHGFDIYDVEISK